MQRDAGAACSGAKQARQTQVPARRSSFEMPKAPTFCEILLLLRRSPRVLRMLMHLRRAPYEVKTSAPRSKACRSPLALFRRLNGEFGFNWFINLTISVKFFACDPKSVNLLNVHWLVFKRLELRRSQFQPCCARDWPTHQCRQRNSRVTATLLNNATIKVCKSLDAHPLNSPPRTA